MRALDRADALKNDEFYTQLDDIESELGYYDFRDKVVFCNCDGPQSKFVEYFNKIQVRELLVCGLRDDGTGGFESDESIAMLKKADVVVTNPPFSLLGSFLGQLWEYDKRFVVLAPSTILTQGDVFGHFKDGSVWLGRRNGAMDFVVPDSDDYHSYGVDAAGNRTVSVGAMWLTNFGDPYYPDELVLSAMYDAELYPKYDSYDAIEVSKVAAIPMDYMGEMGVPVSFAHKYNPKQFELIDHHDPILGGENLFKRILIRRVAQTAHQTAPDRFPVFDNPRKNEVLDILRTKHLPIGWACKFVGVGRRTFYAWKDADPDFADAVEMARAEVMAALIRQSEGQHQSWKILSAMFRTEFGEHVDVSVGVTPVLLGFTDADDSTQETDPGLPVQDEA